MLDKILERGKDGGLGAHFNLWPRDSSHLFLFADHQINQI